MKKILLVKKIPSYFPIDENFIPESEGFSPIREPKNLILMQIISLPFAFVLGFAAYLLSVFLKVSTFLTIISFYEIFLLFALIILIIPLHEVAHALFYPERLTSERVIFGFSKKQFLFFAHFSGNIPKWQYLLIYMAPQIFLTILPILLLGFLNLAKPIESFIFWICFSNAVFGCGDLLYFMIILFQVPNGSVLRSKGYKTYFKRIDN